jgi:calcium/proton exchanger cax
MIAQTMSSFMFVATGALILPAAYDTGLNSNTGAGVLALSRGTAVVLLILYVLFLVYQLKTHSHVFETEGHPDDDDEQAETMGPPVGASVLTLTLLVVTVAVSFCSDYLVGSIDDVVVSFGISKTFIGLILVPMVGNTGIPPTFAIMTGSGTCYMYHLGIPNKDGPGGRYHTWVVHANSPIFNPFPRCFGMGLGHPHEFE